MGYKDPQASVAPFVNNIWNCLKYEVRNGEVDETINATLETLRAMAARLEGDALRNFILTVLRECLDDLSNPAYAAQAGKLLVCTASANVGAFVLVVSPAAKQVMEDLRHTKSRDHKRDLLALLNAILQVRSLFTGDDITGENRAGMESTEPVIHSLFDLAYKPCLQSPDAVVSRKAVEGMGILVGQSSLASREKLLLDDATCTAISSSLIERLVNPTEDLVDEVVVALQKVVMAWPPAFTALMDESLGAPSSPGVKEGFAEDHTALTSRLAYIACSELPRRPSDAFTYFIGLVSRLCRNLGALLDKPETSAESLIVYPAALQSAMRYFKDALDERLQTDISNLELPAEVSHQTWTEYICKRYAVWNQISGSSPDGEKLGGDVPSPFADSTALEPNVIYNDYFLVCLYITRCLYRRSTQVVTGDEQAPLPLLTLTSEISKPGASSRHWQGQYLHLVSSLATFVIGQLSQSQQSTLKLQEEVVTLFRGEESASAPGGGEPPLRDILLKPSQPLSAYEKNDLSGLPSSSSMKQRFPISLSLGILQPLHPRVVESLVSTIVPCITTLDHLTPSDSSLRAGSGKNLWYPSCWPPPRGNPTRSSGTSS